jgi:peptidoglycan/xylan/chitin deacetylase (PgdA/CDA1 family)
MTGERNRAVILMYHRIRKEKTDPWELCVSPAHFAQHLQVLKHECRVHPLSRLKEVVQGKTRTKNIFITFDDGCLDNYQLAAPALRACGFPATFFIPSRILRDAAPFWWEVVDHLFWSSPALPERLELGSGNNRFSGRLEPHLLPPDPLREDGWSANREQGPTGRCRLYVELCDWIRERSIAEQQHITTQLLEAAGAMEDGGRTAGGRPGKMSARMFRERFGKMSPEQIASLAKEGFAIGAHTVNHPALGHQPREVQQAEMALSKATLENLTGKPVTSLAYPHGDVGPDTAAIAAACGFSEACTTDSGVITKDPAMLVLPRMLVRDLDQRGFREQLNHFLKLRQ